MNREVSDIQAGFRKCRGTRDQIANILLNHRKSKRIPEKNIHFCFIDYTKAFDCVDQNKLWKILKEMGIPDHLTCLLRNLYAGKEAIVRTNMEQQTGSKLGKEYWSRNGNPLQYSCLENPMDRGAWQATVQGVAKSWT